MARQKRQNNRESDNSENTQTNFNSNQNQTNKTTDSNGQTSTLNERRGQERGLFNTKMMKELIEQKIYLRFGNRAFGENRTLLDQIIRKLEFEYRVPKSNIDSRIEEIKTLDIHSIGPHIEEYLSEERQPFLVLYLTLFGNVTDILAALIYHKFFADQSS